VNRISNPAYQGVWVAKTIANPEYKEDDSLYKYADFGFIGFDLWQVKGGTIFDNIIITDDIAEADTLATEFKAVREAELAKQKADEDAKKEDTKVEEKKDDGDDDDEN